MKIANAVFGALITFLLATGVLFKTMHWPGAGPMIVLGASSLSIYVFFVAVANIMSYEKKTMIAICNGFGAFGGSILAVGLLFKIMHWPGAGSMMTIGFPLIIIICFIFMIGYVVIKEPIKLSPGTFFATICFGILIYGVSVSGTPYSSLLNSVQSAEKSHSLIYHSSNSLDIHTTRSPNVVIYKKAANDLIIHILKLESKLYEKVDGLPPHVADTSRIRNINGKDNYDIPTHLMGLSEPWKPVKVSGMEEFSAITLKEKIRDFNKIFGDDKTYHIKVDDIKSSDGYMNTWEVETFYHIPLAQVISILKQLQLEALVKCNAAIVSKSSAKTIIQNEPKEEQ